MFSNCKTLKAAKKVSDRAVESLPAEVRGQDGSLAIDSVPAALSLIGLQITRAAWESVKPRVEEHVKRRFRAVDAHPAPQDGAIVAVAPHGAGQALVQASPALIKFLTRRQYADLPHEALVDCVLRRDSEIRALRESARLAKKQFAKQRRSMEHAVVVARGSENVDPNEEWQIQRRGNLKLTQNASFAVAIRKSMTNMAAGDLGVAALDDLSRGAVYRCETDTAAALIASCRGFHRDQEDAAAACVASGSDVIISHAYRSDATTSNVWQRSKLCGLELESYYTIGVGGPARCFRDNSCAALPAWLCRFKPCMI